MKKRLKAKGWKTDEIVQADHAIKWAQKKKHPDIKKVERSMFWFSLAAGVIGTFIFSFAIIPVLVAGTRAHGIIASGGFGLLLGLLISASLKRMHWFEAKHHLSIALIIPAIAIFSLVLVTLKVNELNIFAGLATTHDPLLLGAAYSLAFITPIAAVTLSRRPPE